MSIDDANKDERLRDRIVRGLGWSVTRVLANVGIQFVTIVVISRLLTPAEVGTVAIGFGVVQMLLVISSLGTSDALIQRREIGQGHIDSAFVLSSAISSLMVFIVFLGAPWLSMQTGTPELTTVLRVLSVILLMRAAGAIFESLAMRDLRFRTIATVDLVATVLGYSIPSIVCALLGFGIWSLVIGHVGGFFLRFVLLGRHYFRRLGVGANRSDFRDLLGFGLPYCLTGLIQSSASSLDRVLVGAMVGAGAAGIYVRARQVDQTGAGALGHILGAVLFPAMSRVQDDVSKLTRAFRCSLTLVSLISLPGAFVIVVVAPPLIPFALGGDWSGVVLPAQILAIALFLRTVSHAASLVVISVGRVRERAIIEFIHAILVLLSIVALHGGGLSAVCTGIVLALFIRVALLLTVAKRILGINDGDIAFAIMPGAIGLLVLAGIYFGCQVLFGPWMSTVAGAVFFLFCAAGLMGYVCLFASWPGAPREVLDIRSEYLGKFRRASMENR